MIKIGNQVISPSHKPFIIAEISANHNGSLDAALRLIDKAKEAGASAVKLQTYKPDTITFNSKDKDFIIDGGLWDGKSLYDLYEEAHTPWDWHEKLFNHAKKKGILIFSSPFDSTAIDLLESLGCPAYKIASFEVVDLQLIATAAATNKPLIISTGMASFDEISEAVECARSNGCSQLALLHCVSGYPANPNEYNLRTIKSLKDNFKCIVGLSDHTLDNVTAITSISFEASIIEKHFTLDSDGGGPDDSFSLNPEGLKNLVNSTKIAWEALGSVNYEPTKGELPNIKFRRSLYVVEDLKAGDQLTSFSLKSIRPGFGIAPKYYKDLIGKCVNKDIKAPHPISFEDIK